MIEVFINIIKQTDLKRIIPLCNIVNCTGVRCMECPLNSPESMKELISELEGIVLEKKKEETNG